MFSIERYIVIGIFIAIIFSSVSWNYDFGGKVSGGITVNEISNSNATILGIILVLCITGIVVVAIFRIKNKKL